MGDLKLLSWVLSTCIFSDGCLAIINARNTNLLVALPLVGVLTIEECRLAFGHHRRCGDASGWTRPRLKL